MARMKRRYPLTEALLQRMIAAGEPVDLAAFEERAPWHKHALERELECDLAEEFPRKRISAQCLETRKQRGDATRRKIIKLWETSRLAKHERAAVIAKSLEVTPQYIRQVLKKAGLK